jgi:hypothetical protein
MTKLISETGKVWSMGNNPSRVRYSWKQFGAVPDQPLIPRSQWKALIDALPGGATAAWPYLPPTHDQDGVGQCNCDATTGAMESCRLKMGFPLVSLSAGDLYGRINGGSDNGSTLEDGIREAMGNGVGTVASYGGDIWSSGRQGVSQSERGSYKVLEAFLCPTFDHCFSAVLQGWDLISGVMWYPNFDTAADGWLPAQGRGRPGGHAVHGYKPTYKGDAFGIWHHNSWHGTGWGTTWMTFDGLGVFPEAWYSSNSQVGGWWAVRQMTDTETDLPALLS